MNGIFYCDVNFLHNIKMNSWHRTHFSVVQQGAAETFPKLNAKLSLVFKWRWKRVIEAKTKNSQLSPFLHSFFIWRHFQILILPSTCCRYNTNLNVRVVTSAPVKCRFFFPLQSMEAMFEWEDEEDDKEDKVASSLDGPAFR